VREGRFVSSILPTFLDISSADRESAFNFHRMDGVAKNNCINYSWLVHFHIGKYLPKAFLSHLVLRLLDTHFLLQWKKNMSYDVRECIKHVFLGWNNIEFQWILFTSLVHPLSNLWISRGEPKHHVIWTLGRFLISWICFEDAIGNAIGNAQWTVVVKLFADSPQSMVSGIISPCFFFTVFSKEHREMFSISLSLFVILGC